MEHDAEQLRVSRPPADRPVLVYDGECGFCKRWVARWKGMTLGRVDYEPFQQAAERFAEVPLERFEHGVQLIFPDGRVVSGAHAVFNLYAIAGVRRWPLWMYEHAPGFEQVTEAAYAFVGRHRGGFATLDRLAFGKHPVRSTYHFSEWLFLRLLGVIYLIAFLSLGVQMDGLIGSKGILPAAEFIGTFQRGYGNALFWRVPTLCWFNCSDGFLHLLCWGGAALAVLLIAGIAPAVTTALLWICYLSLVHVGQVFLGYQWDALLLETGFLAIFFAPWVWWSRPGHQPRTSRTIFLLQRLLLFRLMFFSGMAKLLSGDATWRQWRALDYHYQTQPLPTWVGWYAHQLPAGIHQLSVGIMFVIELIIPFLYFMPRRLRMAGFWWTMTLQVLIALTGNYGFFNLLAIVLCVPLLDDAFWPRWLRERITCWRESCLQKQWWRWPGWIIAPLAAAILLVTWVRFDELLGRGGRGIGSHAPFALLAPLRERADEFELVNSYGLFAMMTTERPEIIIEGSDDGVEWKEYGFKWKPGDVMRRPGFVIGHMPRLDWQMWFAAVDVYYAGRGDEWMRPFLGKLLENSPEVLGLMGENPFAGRPPKYVRATVYDYRFTDGETKRRTGAWWERRRLGRVEGMTRGEAEAPPGVTR